MIQATALRQQTPAVNGEHTKKAGSKPQTSSTALFEQLLGRAHPNTSGRLGKDCEKLTGEVNARLTETPVEEDGLDSWDDSLMPEIMALFLGTPPPTEEHSPARQVAQELPSAVNYFESAVGCLAERMPIDSGQEADAKHLHTLIERALQKVQAGELALDTSAAAMVGQIDQEARPNQLLESAHKIGLSDLMARLKEEFPDKMPSLVVEPEVQAPTWDLARYWALRGGDRPEIILGENEEIADDGAVIDKLLIDVQANLGKEHVRPSLDSSLAPAKHIPGEDAGDQDSPQIIAAGDRFSPLFDGFAQGLNDQPAQQTPTVSYTARPNMLLEQQLEQGMAIGVQQLRLLRSQETITVRMRLYPEDLGEVLVDLKLAGDVLTAQLRTQHPAAANALRLELPNLRDNLVNQGFSQVFLGAETTEQFGQSGKREEQHLTEQQRRRLQRIAVVKTDIQPDEITVTNTGRLDYRL